MTQAARITALVLATLVVVALLWQFGGVLVLFMLSLAVAAAVRPVIDRITERGVPSGLSLLLTYGIGIVLLGLILYSLSNPLVTEIQRATNDFEKAYEVVETEWPKGTTVQRYIAGQLPSPDKLSAAIASAQAGTLVQTALGFTLSLFDNVTRVIVVLVLSIYWSADRVRFERLWLSLLPAELRARARNIWQAIEHGVGAYIRSELVQSLLAGLLLGLGYAMMHLPYPTLLALMAALVWLIPLMGVLLAVVPVFVAGLVISPALGVIAALYTLAVLLAMAFVVEPRFFNRGRYSPLLMLVVVIAMADSFGILGVVFGPPLAAAIQILLGQLWPPVSVAAPAGAETDIRIGQLQERLAALRQMAAEQPQPSPEVASLIERLDKLIDEADRVL